MKPTEYTLDIAKWRCGSYRRNHMGEGNTLMKNNEGFMCCLGQFASQIPGVHEHLLIGAGNPQDVARRLRESGREPRYDENFIDENTHQTSLAHILVGVNDNDVITNSSRVEEIKRLLDAKGIKLNVVNEHLIQDWLIDYV